MRIYNGEILLQANSIIAVKYDVRFLSDVRRTNVRANLALLAQKALQNAKVYISTWRIISRWLSVRDGLINAPLHESGEGANNQMHPRSPPERIPWDRIPHSVCPFGMTNRVYEKDAREEK